MPPSSTKVITLNDIHHAIHQVTGDIAKIGNKCTEEDIQRWTHALIQAGMELSRLPVPDGKNKTRADLLPLPEVKR